MRDTRAGIPVRDSLAERQRELALRHEVLGREHPESGRYDDLLERVFDATDDLMRVVDEAAARGLRRRRLTATALLVVAVAGVALVVAGLLPVVVLVAAGFAMAVAGALWITAHLRRGASSGGTASGGAASSGVASGEGGAASGRVASGVAVGAAKVPSPRPDALPLSPDAGPARPGALPLETGAGVEGR